MSRSRNARAPTILNGGEADQRAAMAYNIAELRASLAETGARIARASAQMGTLTALNGSARNDADAITISDDEDNNNDISKDAPGSPFSNDPQYKCVICHERMGDRETPVTLKCGHTLGSMCMNSWLHIPGRKNGCPLCRAELFHTTDVEADDNDGSRPPTVAEMDRALHTRRQRRPPTPVALTDDAVYEAATDDVVKSRRLFQHAWSMAKSARTIANNAEAFAAQRQSPDNPYSSLAIAKEHKFLRSSVETWRAYQSGWEAEAKEKYREKKLAEQLVLTIVRNRGLIEEYLGPTARR